jgi:hypothetical protein
VGISAATASAATTPWTSAISNVGFETHAASSASKPETLAFDGLFEQSPLETANVQIDSRYVSGSGIGIVGTLQFGAPAASAASIAAHASGTSKGSGAKTTPAAHSHAVHAPATPSKPTPAHAAPAKVPAAHATPAAARKAAPPPHATPAHVAPAHHAQAPAPPARPYIFYDSVTPTAIPAGQEVATYADGNYTATPASVAGRTHVLWIDTNGSDPSADALDIEPGDATPVGAAQWVQAKLSADHGAVAILYTMISEWQAVKDNVAALPDWMQSHVRYWIADPTGVPHVVPGSNATQWYWGNSYDISTADPGF